MTNAVGRYTRTCCVAEDGKLPFSIGADLDEMAVFMKS
jgi:hypothetical protein